MLSRAFLAPFVALSLAAGCLQGGPEPAPGDGAPSTDAFYPPISADRLPIPDVDFATAYDATPGGRPGAHSDPSEHEFEYGLEVVGYNPLGSLTEGESPVARDSSYIAMDTWGTYACVAHFLGGAAGAAIVDISDPTDPVVIGSADSGMQNSDCQFTDDGNFLLVASYTGVHKGLPGVPPPIGDAGAEGVLIYDVSDKTSPRFLWHDTTGSDANAYHNVFTAQINGVHYVFQTYTGNILSLDPANGHLTLVSTVPVADHDMWVGHHPITGEWIMITGAGDGAMIYNVDDPATPKELGVWEAHDGFTGWHRQWPLLGTVDGRALMLVAGEEGCGATTEATWYTVLDFTDPNDLIEMGHWRVPTSCVTQHEFETWNGYVATGNYHEGLWLIDIGTLERAADPVTLGYYLPHNLPQTSGGANTNQPGASNPNVWGAYFDDRGYIYAADSFSGLYVYKFGATPA